MTRKEFLKSASTIVGAPLILESCSSAKSDDGYVATALRTWRPTDRALEGVAAERRELVRYATLAPSSHNTQCWKFRVEANAIWILPDLARRCPAVDPDDHHLFVSLGCAAENLIQAALAQGLKGTARLEPDHGNGVRISFERTKAFHSPLFQAIPQRQCTRSEFDGTPVSIADLKVLERAATGEGVRVLMFTERSAMETILEYVVSGNTAQMNDPAFVRELKQWIRFNDAQAVRTGDGLFSRATGSPSVPPWLGGLLFGMFFTKKSENDKYAKHVRSSSGIAVFVSDENSRAHWVEAGRCYERFALQATALGIRNAMINQPVEVPDVRPKFAAYLGVPGQRPDLVVRFGRGPRMPQSLRRPVQAVIV